MNELVKVNSGELIESVLIKGDLSKLTPQERGDYYMRVCDSVGLNPLTKPLEYITLNGKLTLYARKDATDQLRSIHGVSVEEMSETERDGVFIVTAKVRNAAGRTDMAKGAVTINGLKGDALANALMKAETKAKRRATLSICGLGILDETEVETIPANAKRIEPEADVITTETMLLSVDQLTQLNERIAQIGLSEKSEIRFCAALGVTTLDELHATRFSDAMDKLNNFEAERNARRSAA